MLYQFSNDYGLREPQPSLATDYCDLVCSNNSRRRNRNSLPRRPNSKPIADRMSGSQSRSSYLPPQLRRYIKQFGGSVDLNSKHTMSWRDGGQQRYPRELTTKLKGPGYKLRPDEIPDLTRLPALGVNVEDGMKPFFHPCKSADSGSSKTGPLNYSSTANQSHCASM